MLDSEATRVRSSRDKIRPHQTATVMEINANPIWLDLNAELVRRAVDAGVKPAIGTDARTPEHFDFIRFGVLTARSGWASKANVSDALSVGELCAAKTQFVSSRFAPCTLIAAPLRLSRKVEVRSLNLQRFDQAALCL